ncbi:MAG: hypothetical protein BroJett030_13440 [Alphaproteobacteria bacterium]|nr:MAG: hypothetical protein BroJett030_13440 [Alphaproteobacteria bacterium]
MVTARHAAAGAPRRPDWEQDVRIRTRPGRPDSGVKLYVTDRDAAGMREFMANTGFRRYPRLMATLVALLGQFPAEAQIRVLIVPLSVGLEAVSLAIAGLEAGLFQARSVTIEGFDISAKATALARSGVYPRLFFPDDLTAFAPALREADDGFVEVDASVMAHVRVLDPADVLTFAPGKPYDMVVCLNLLMHLPEKARPALVARLAELTAPGGILCLNNNQEWPDELVPHFAALTAPAAGFVSLHEALADAPGTGTTPAGPVPAFAVTDANAMILRRAGEGRSAFPSPPAHATHSAKPAGPTSPRR